MTRHGLAASPTRIQIDPVDFTNDKPEMIEILRTELQPAGPTPLWNAVNVAMTALLHQEKRRVVLVFTDGVDAPMNFRSNNVTLKDATKRAEEENVMVYAIGLAGQNGYRGGGGRPMGHYGGFGGGGGRWSGNGRPGGSRMEKPDEGLPKIAAATGGGYFELTNTNDLGSTFRRVADELHRQYLIGFEPEQLDGKTHRLEVRVKRQGMTARSRKSYVASRSGNDATRRSAARPEEWEAGSRRLSRRREDDEDEITQAPAPRRPAPAACDHRTCRAYCFSYTATLLNFWPCAFVPAVVTVIVLPSCEMTRL